KVVQDAVHDDVRAVARAVLVALLEDRARPEDRVPGLRAANLIVELAQLLLGDARVVHGLGHGGDSLAFLRGAGHDDCPWRASARRPEAPPRTSCLRRASSCVLPRLFQTMKSAMEAVR